MRFIIALLAAFVLISCAARKLAPLGSTPSMHCIKGEEPIATEMSGHNAVWECQVSRCTDSQEIYYEVKGFAITYKCIDKELINAANERRAKILELQRKAEEAEEAERREEELAKKRAIAEKIRALKAKRQKLKEFLAVCLKSGSVCTSTPRACCSGICAANITDISKPKVCADKCNDASDCRSGCCTALVNTSEKVCAPVGACSNTCITPGSSCNTDYDCCMSGVCITEVGTGNKVCKDRCVSNSDCRSGCCASLSNSPAKVCSAKFFCK